VINKKSILKAANSLVHQYNLSLKLLGVEEGTEEVIIYFTSNKKVRLQDLARELEFQLNLPIKLERVKKSELGKLGGINILGKYPCCAPFLKKCPFGGKTGCGYGFGAGKTKIRKQKIEPAKERVEKPQKPQKKAKKRKKMVRRLVIKRQK